MRRRRCVFALLIAVSTIAMPNAQRESGVPAPTTARRARLNIFLDDDGTVESRISSSTLVNTVRGIVEAGTVKVPFTRSFDTVTFDYVRVRKQNGTIVDTPAAAALDVPASVTPSAPVYTDQMTRHVNVRGLEVGDVVEYEVRVRSRPTFDGHFATQGPLLTAMSAEDGEVTFSLPAHRRAIVKSTGAQPAISETGGRRTYRWTTSRDEPVQFTDLVKSMLAETPEIQISTFADWNDVGTALRPHWAGRANVVPEIERKALELTAGLGDEASRIDAIFRFVSSMRYVAVALGSGGIQPNSAIDVLASGFGDCKDKHILTEALLRAVGIESEPVFVGAGSTLDETVPSPLQFNHVITRVRRSDGGETWLDATLELVQAGYLAPVVRGRQALRVGVPGPAELLRTPADPPRPTGRTTRADATIDPIGRLTAQVEDQFAGDLEMPLRLTVRQLTPEESDGIAPLLAFSALGGAISDIEFPTLADPAQPFVVRYKLVVERVSSWSDRSMAPLLPVISFSTMSPNAGRVRLFKYRDAAKVTLTLPRGLDVQLGTRDQFGVSYAQDFARFSASGSVRGDVVEFQQQFDLLIDDVPDERQEDINGLQGLLAAELPKVIFAERWRWGSNTSNREEWPTGTSPEANALVSRVPQANTIEQVALLEQAVVIDPMHPSAWAQLGWVQNSLNRRSESDRSLRRQIDVAPSATAYKVMAGVFRTRNEAGRAAAALETGMGSFPDDRDLPALLAETLVESGRYADAARAAESEIVERPMSSRLHIALGRAQLRSGQHTAGIAALRMAVRLEYGANILSMAARELADAGVELELAREWARTAIDFTNGETANLEFATLTPGTRDTAGRIARYFETMGLVLLRRNEFELAGEYCDASWMLMRGTRAADCLGQVAESRKNTAEAIRYYESAHQPQGEPVRDETRARLERLTGKPFTPDVTRGLVMAQVGPSRIALSRPGGVSGTGGIEMMAGSDGRVREVRLLGGNLTPAAIESVRGIDIGPAIPENGTARLLRNGVLDCSVPGQQTCTVVLFPSRHTISGL